MKNLILVIILMLCITISGCGKDSSIGIIGGADGPTSIYVSDKGESNMYEQITAEKAKEIMDSGKEYVLLDVREQDEFESGRIEGAILIPYTEIEEKAELLIPEKESLILVYCRSGRRSKIASLSLAGLGYKNVKEFGGIIDWPYEVVK